MIAIIDYDAGNLKSVEKALAYLGEESVITRDFHTIEQADKVILPGVGSFGVAMDNLKRYELDKVIHEVCERKVPFLGICLGLQLMFEGSEESEGVEGLGLLEGKIIRIPDTYGLISAGTPCIYRIMEDCFRTCRWMLMYISCILIIYRQSMKKS